jgi:adhesin transport system outer membrane protein
MLALAAGVHAQSLNGELAGLLANHPQIQSTSKTAESTGKEIDKALAGFYPSVAANADGGAEYIDTPTERAKQFDSKAWERTRNVLGLTVTQSLFNGFATTSAVRTARLNRAIADITLEGTRQNTLFEGITVYIDVLRQRRLVDLARSNEETIQIQLNLEDERVQRGSGIAVDVLQAKSRLQISKERRVNFEGAVKDAVSRYIQVFDHAPDLEAMMDPVPPVEMLPSELETAIDIALRENPAVSNSDANIEAVKESRRTVKSEYMPTFDLVGRWNYEKHKNATIGTRRDYSVLLEANWNLFTGFSTKASLAQAAFNYGASQDNHRFVTRKVIEQIKLSWQALLTVRERLELLENAINIASEVFDSRQQLREAGKETVINVLDAESEIFNARINFTAASYDERIAVYQLLLAMGRLNAGNLNLAAN